MSTTDVEPSNIEAEEIAWAAGLFEGEGTMLPRGKANILISVSMTDRDVVERWQRIVGAGKLVAVRGRRPGWKTQYRVDIHRAEDVFRIVALLRPYFGERRAARADELIAALTARIAEVTAPRSCSVCGAMFAPAFAAGKQQRFCSRRCSRNSGTHFRRRSRLFPQEQMRIGE